jgi:hypothetical protein
MANAVTKIVASTATKANLEFTFSISPAAMREIVASDWRKKKDAGLSVFRDPGFRERSGLLESRADIESNKEAKPFHGHPCNVAAHRNGNCPPPPADR